MAALCPPRGTMDIERFLSHIPEPNGENDELIILKGHLLLEELLHSFLFERMYTYEPIESLRPTFKTLLSFSESLCQYEGYDWLWEMLGELNKIRNHLAHKLDGESFEDKKQRTIELFESYKPDVLTEEIKGFGEAGGHDNSIGVVISYLASELDFIIPDKKA